VTHRLTRPSRPLRSFAPPGSPFAFDLAPGRGEEEGPVLSWAVVPLESLLQNDPGFGLSRSDVGQAGPGDPRSPGRQSPGPCSQIRPPTPGPRSRDPPIRMVRENHADHRQAATPRPPRSCRAGSRVASHPRHPGRGNVSSVRPAPPLGGAPCLPRPSPEPPARGDAGWTSETHRKDRAGGSTSREADRLFGGFVPSRTASKA